MSEQNRLGLQLARAARYDAAESLFVAALTRSPGDASVLNNLGNLRALSGAPDIATSFYVEAARHAPDDGGIQLNLGISLLDAGREADAESTMALGLALAGGEDEGARLLGLSASPQDSVRAGARDTARLRAVLKRAALAVPRLKADSLGWRDRVVRKSRIVSKTGAVRASDPAAATVSLYWKD